MPTALTAAQLSPKLTLSQPEVRSRFLLGQDTGTTELAQAAADTGPLGHIFMSAPPYVDTIAMFKAAIRQQPKENRLGKVWDWCYAENLADARRPLCLRLKAGSGDAFCQGVTQLLQLKLEEKAFQTELDSLVASQPQEGRLAQYLEGLLDAMASGEEFNHPVLINLLVNQPEAGRVPIIHNRDLSEVGLFGEITFEIQEGTVSAHQHLLRPGDLHRANGGYLLLSASELLEDPELWRRIKESLFAQSIHWTQYRGQMPGNPLFMPDPMPLDIKLVLFGDRQDHLEMLAMDRDLSQLFPYFVEWVPYATQDQAAELAGHLLRQCDKAGLKVPTLEAIATLLCHGCRLFEDQQRIALAHHRYNELLTRAHYFSKGSEITEADILAAIKAREQAHALPKAFSRSAMAKGQILIETQGARIGQVNGLTVLDMGNAEFGEPSRITATVHHGDGDVIDIERKAELAGNIHAKGVMILSAFLAHRFAKDGPLHLSASLVFEQSYHEVDGDSASAGELICLLSALSELPVRQDIAITGAIDQFGNVQAIGGVNAKIEGFFEVCAARGLTGSQGVVLPQANLDQLNLSSPVIQAVAEGRFHIWSVSHVDQAMALMMGTQAGEADAHGQFPEDSVYGRIHGRLEAISELEEPIMTLGRRFWSWLGLGRH
ncbi:AAA family ATPase [Gallaecimonas kandeliae]|uniref:AAA family ATPase n=1 Tax=Gallaecimonas kandeliae TaxID=3029055 RepID=UPI0026475951|nr:AAA family ATPase [Gallaecimonas kandeliae]WKE67356.1 AAA family ATPase [Gallaecimonas kandeliae]